MSPRRALRFILLSLILAVLLMGAAVILNGRLRQLQPVAATPSLEMQLASLAMKLDGNGLGSQVISGTQVSVRLSPYPVQAGQESAMSVVATSLSGQIAVITPTLYIISKSAESSGPSEFNMIRENGGAYEVQGLLFPQVGVWQARISFYLNPTQTSSVILIVEAQ